MSTLLHDLPSHAAFALALTPQVITADVTGPAVELPDGDGPAFVAIQTGTFASGTGVAVDFESSSNGTSWTAVSVELPTIAANGVAVAPLPRDSRYVRCAVSLTGGSPSAAIAVLVGQQKKVV
jgi:hypothetical protein